MAATADALSARRTCGLLMLTETEDIFGQVVKYHDYIAVSMSRSGKTTLCIGHVIGFEEEQSKFFRYRKNMMRVRWHEYGDSSWLPESGISVIEIKSNNFIKIDLDAILSSVGW